MSPCPIVKGFDVVKGAVPGLCSCLKGLSINAFPFEAMKETFHRGIIVTVSSSTHAAYQAFLLQKRLVALTGVRTATIGVMEQPSLWTAPSDRHAQRLDHQRRVLRGGGTPVGGSGQFGLLSHGLDSMGDSPYPFF